MSYGTWIDMYCECIADWDFYRDEWRKLAQLATDYLSAFRQSPEGRVRLDGFVIPELGHLNRIGTTHRRVIERLYWLADIVAQLEYRAGFDQTDGYLAAQIWSGKPLFIPPTHRKDNQK